MRFGVSDAGIRTHRWTTTTMSWLLLLLVVVVVVVVSGP
jgi:hypothetical protein